MKDTSTNYDENYNNIPLPLDGGGLGWPPAQRASGSERGGQNNLFPLPFTLLDMVFYSALLSRKRSI
jgi:hypothetical protein